MSTLDGKTIASTFKDLLQVSNNNVGVDNTIRYIEDGEGTRSALALSTSAVELSGNLVPAQDVTFDLGSATHRFKDLYLSGNTIYLGDTTFSTADIQAVKSVQDLGVENLPTFSEVATPAQGAKADSAIQPNDPRNLMPASNMTQDIGSAANHWMNVYTHHLNAHGNVITTGDVIVGGEIHGPAILKIDPAAIGDNTGRVVIAGDLQVDGTTTTVNSTTMTVSGKTITLAEGATDATQVDGAGVEVAGSGASISYTSGNDSWNTNKTLIAPTLQSENTVTEQLNVTGNAAIDQMDLTAIEQIKNDQAVAVFIYDTSKDSDGGAWRHRVTHTSWYNEQLNTSTRGGRKEFPAVAVIVAEADKVTIYDGDDPDLPMWMVFEGTDSGWKFIQYGNSDCTSLFALNGILCVGNSDGGTTYGNLAIINFIKETARHHHNNPGVVEYHGLIVSRNVLQPSWSAVTGAAEIVNAFVNDVAMTVLPDAPIDADTGLPVPTIAVATDRGVSVIKHDGSVTSSLSINTSTVSSIDKVGDYWFITCQNEQVAAYWPVGVDLPAGSGNSHLNNVWGTTLYTSTVPATLINNGHTASSYPALGSDDGLTVLDYSDEPLSPTSSVSYITSKYNTGWMPGDIKLATLSDTVSGAIGTDFDPPELIVNGEFDTDVSGWTNTEPVDWANSTMTWENGQAVGYRAVGEAFRWHQAVDTVVGAEYVIQAKSITGNGGYYVTDVADASTPWVAIANDGAHIGDTNQYKFTAITPVTYITLNVNKEDTECRFDGITMKRTNQLVLNGQFTVDDNWTKEAGWTIPGDGTAVATEATSTIYQTIDDLVVGKQYIISVDVLTVDSGSISYRAGADNYRFDTTTGIKEVVFTADATSMIVGAISDNFTGTIGSVSVKQTNELINNGTFVQGASGWIADGETQLVVDPADGTATFTLSTDSGAITQELPDLEPGDYVFTFDWVGGTEANIYTTLQDNTDPAKSTRYSLINASDHDFGTKTATVTITDEQQSNNLRLAIYGYFWGQSSAGETIKVDNVSFRRATEDRSVNDNGLQVVGRVEKTPVAPGAEIVAYSGFSADNYLTQPYNPDLDFGTGDFCVMGWVKTNTSSNYQTILDFGLYDTDGSRRHFAIAANTGELYMAIQGSNTIGTHSVSVGDGSWHCCVATVVHNKIDFYIDGKFVGSNNSLTLNSLDDSVGLRVGYGINDQFALEGNVSLIRISATTPTADQIAKMYREERELFQPGAQATLFGGSDAVTALSHDGELLHVGTSEGKSQFRGLRRVKHHDTPINNFISTGADFTIEQ